MLHSVHHPRNSCTLCPAASSAVSAALPLVNSAMGVSASLLNVPFSVNRPCVDGLEIVVDATSDPPAKLITVGAGSVNKLLVVLQQLFESLPSSQQYVVSAVLHAQTGMP